jgi:hypothetical protein
MPEDAYGNYQAGLEPGPSLPSSVSRLRSGTGAPASTLGNVGDGYVNRSNGDFYTKKTTGWELQSGGGGASIAQVIATTDANPNTAVIVPEDPAQGAIFTQDGTDLTVLWRWDVTDQVWRQVTG